MSYITLKLILTQQKLNQLNLSSITKEISNEIEYISLIDNFV